MFQHLTPVTKNIIIANIIVFFGGYLLLNYGIDLVEWLAGYFPLSPNFKSWQIITHMFMHGSFGHILFNMFALFSFGPTLEQFLGGKKFLMLYFIAGLGGFALYNLINLFTVYNDIAFLKASNFDVDLIYQYAKYSYAGEKPLPTNDIAVRDAAQSLFNTLRTPMVGASGAIFGVVAAFSTLFPNAKLMFMFIPYPIKAKYLLPIIIAVSIFLGFKQFSWDNVAHFAHIGGALFGFLYIYFWKKNNHYIG